jgi:glutamate/tyrosine decarboxylase-like PLP-dependent enzyme
VAILRGRGLRQVIADLRSPLTAIRDLAAYLQKQPDIELLHKPETGILCFRLRPADVPEQQLDGLQRQLYDQLMASGKRAISLTKLGDKQSLRIAIVSPNTTAADLRQTVDELRRINAVL